MLTKRERTLLENHIYGMLKESIFENGYYENMFPEGGKKKNDNEKRKKSDSNKGTEEDSAKRDSVLKWLDSAQELHSVLAYALWPDMDEDDARSLFSKKYNGESQGKHYEFDPEEINTLYNLRGDFISDAGLDGD